jgi:hypothetical protein
VSDGNYTSYYALVSPAISLSTSGAYSGSIAVTAASYGGNPAGATFTNYSGTYPNGNAGDSAKTFGLNASYWANSTANAIQTNWYSVPMLAGATYTITMAPPATIWCCMSLQNPSGAQVASS